MRSVGAAAAAVVLAVLLLAGCAAIPTSGPVVQNTAPVAEENDPAFVYLPQPPVDGADPDEIVRDFVLAASEGGDYEVAEQFLTTAFAAEWRPDERVLVHVDPWEIEAIAADRIELRIPVAARVDENGVFTPVARAAPVPVQFRLEEVDGQWRIADGPAGVVLAQRVFQGLLAPPVVLQFWDPGFTRLVPDLRWLPRGEEAPTIVRALLNGQAAPLLGVTVSAFPPDSRLARAVEVSGARTAVSLVVPGEQPDAQATDRMQQQLAASLQVSISSIRLTVNGRTAPAAQEAAGEQPSTQDPVVVAGGRFGTLSRVGLREDEDLGPRIMALEPRAVTVSPGQRTAAVLTADGRIAVVQGDEDEPRFVDDRPGLLPATLDQQGWTYSVPRDAPTGLKATAANGAAVELTTDLGGSVVLAIEASTDGTRLLVLIQTGTGPAAYVAGIERDDDGTPTGLSSARYPVTVDADGAVDATWVDRSSVAVLTSGSPVQNVVVQQLGGVSSLMGPLSNARAIVGATRVQDLRALLQSGDLQQRPATVWQSEFASPVDVEVIAVQR